MIPQFTQTNAFRVNEWAPNGDVARVLSETQFDGFGGLEINEPTAIIFDINNLYHRSRAKGFRIDYNKLLKEFSRRCDLRVAKAMMAIDTSEPSAMRWLEFMNNAGYEVHHKPIKRFKQRDSERQEVSGNMDVEIAMEAYQLPRVIRHVIIASCDDDFLRVVNDIKRKQGKKVSVMGVGSGSCAGMSRKLIKSADYYYDLDRLKPLIGGVQRAKTGGNDCHEGNHNS
jgi:uncharacterized LabA/DUF88 family protein